MRSLSLSKLGKIENNSDISLYQIYLRKLHKNIWKYYRYNLFQEITSSFNPGLQTTSESPASFSDGLLV